MEQACQRSLSRALLAETDPAMVRLCRNVLEDSGITVSAVDSGIGAVVAARETCPDLILIGLQLQDVPGREAIAWLRSNPALRSIPIIILATGADEAILAGAFPVTLLLKPISPITLRRVIETLDR